MVDDGLVVVDMMVVERWYSDKMLVATIASSNSKFNPIVNPISTIILIKKKVWFFIKF